MTNILNDSKSLYINNWFGNNTFISLNTAKIHARINHVSEIFHPILHGICLYL